MDEKGLIKDIVRMGPMDIVFSSVVTAYFFKSLVDFEQLKTSFEKLVKIIPILSSIYEKNDDDDTFSVRFVRPSNVEFIKKYVDEDLSHLYLPNEDGIITHDHKKKIHELMENIEVNDNYLFNPVLKKPLFKVTVVETKSKKCIVILCGSHVMEWCSRGLIMKVWSDLYCGKDVNMRFTFDRKWVRLSDPNFDLYKQPIERFRHLDFLDAKDIPEGERGYRSVPAENAVVKRVHFSSEKITHMKKLVKEYVKDESYRFSSNDCITSFLWRLYASIQAKYYGSTMIPLRFVVNIRGIFSKIDQNFIGNAVIYPRIEHISVDTIRTCPFPELVKKMRGTLNCVNEEMVQTYIDTYGSFWKNGNHELLSFLGSTRRKSGLLVNDWRSLDRNLPKFGGDDNCERCAAMSGKLSHENVGYWIVLLGMNGDGLDAYIRFEKHVYEQIKDLDLTTFEALEILKKK